MAREKKNIEKLSFNMDKELAAALREYADEHYMTFSHAPRTQLSVASFLLLRRFISALQFVIIAASVPK